MDRKLGRLIKDRLGGLMRKLFLATLIISASSAFAGLSGCASAPTAQQIQAADYGLPIAQSEAQKIATEWFNNRLKDPMSAVYEWGVVTQGHSNKVPLLGLDAVFGYQLLVSVNAKNSYGGYTGKQRYMLLLKNGAVVRAAKEECNYGSCAFMPL